MVLALFSIDFPLENSILALCNSIFLPAAPLQELGYIRVYHLAKIWVYQGISFGNNLGISGYINWQNG